MQQETPNGWIQTRLLSDNLTVVKVLKTEQAKVKDELRRSIIYVFLALEEPKGINFEDYKDEPFVSLDVQYHLILWSQWWHKCQLY